MARFGFGKNWSAFIDRHFTEERLLSAQKRLLDTLLLPNLDGLTFLDIGSGSGLHSYAAWREGAKRVISFDYDSDSVETTKRLWSMAGSPENWTVMQGDVLNTAFMEQFKDVDIVYSWGVLHHTGNMYKAVENASLPLKERDSAVFFIALYSYNCYQSVNHPTPEYWLEIKKCYNESNSLIKRYLEFDYIKGAYFNVDGLKPKFRALKNLLRDRKTARERGMDWMTDIRDWVGGWPMEFVKEDELAKFCRQKLDLKLVRLLTGEGNTEFVFSKGHTWLEPLLTQRIPAELTGPFVAGRGHLWKAKVEATALADTPDAPRRSTLLLWEDDIPLAYPHGRIHDIEAYGHGRYSHGRDEIFFSTSDNSDPNTNGRKYTFTVDDPQTLAEMRANARPVVGKDHD